MPENKPKFKKPSKKHQPRGLEILHDDKDIIVVNKANGLLTIGTDREREKTAYFLLNLYVKKGNSRSKNRVFIVHRLDKDTSGILVLAKHIKAKRFLQEEWQKFTKKYLAIIHGKMEKREGVISSYLKENKIHRMYSVDDPIEGKLAKTGYQVIKESTKYSLVEIDLYTGRKHQIRVHFAEKGHPVVGDKTYGDKTKGSFKLALHAGSLEFVHPFTKEKMIFETPPPASFNVILGPKNN
jgi:RluA family pseudouridine synthase